MPADDERFRGLFDANFSDLWRFARRRCGTADDADDVTAEVFAIAWRRRDDLPDGDELRLWLFGVARRVFANQRRTDARRDRLRRRLAAIQDRHHDVEPDLPNAELRAALRELSDDDRAVVTMRCWDGLTVGEIAALLECSPNAVSIRLHRARRQIAARLASKGLAIDGHVTTAPEPRKGHPHGCH
jgi:RNA polymerase sigma-70 factor (ECF subfamily)